MVFGDRSERLLQGETHPPKLFSGVCGGRGDFKHARLRLHDHVRSVAKVAKAAGRLQLEGKFVGKLDWNLEAESATHSAGHRINLELRERC